MLDGAMGTAIQRDRPDEAGYRGERFADWPSDLIGNNDLLTLTQPEIIAGIHREYLEAGADIIETNTFNANAVSLRRLRHAGARLRAQLRGAPGWPGARPTRSSTPERPRYVAGALGPTTRTASISPGRQRPGRPQRLLRPAGRGVPRGGPRPRRRRRRPADHRDDLRHPQRQGRDLRGRDALRGARPPLAGHHLRHHHRRVRPHPVRARSPRRSGTPCATSGRSPSASTARSAPRRCGPTSPSSRGSPTRFVSCYPNAGLPNAFGEYDEAPEETAGDRRRVRRQRASSTSSAAAAAPRPTTSRAIAAAVDGKPRRDVARGRARACGSPASSRSRSPRTACSSTSASAPTSPARRGSAT